MNNFLYSMKFSFEKMSNEIHKILNMTVYDDEGKREIFFVVGTCLHWILDYAERIDVREQDKEILSAFKYANNCLKHSIEVKKITDEVGGFEFPIKIPFESPEREVIWSIVDDGDKRWENQRKKYKKFLEGKNVNRTCKNVIGLLEKYEL
ncbi:MAG: hypothetical protein HDR15_02890 [Lachnospiraceae bacterium]|nr:hypothetical protein [Lachnospiraceae bacterium]